MKKMFLVFTMLFCAVLFSCSNEEGETVGVDGVEQERWTVESILEEYPEADIFLYNGSIYTTNIDWVDELTLTKGEKIGVITEQAEKGDTNYENGTASKLTEGTIIYKAEEREDILIAEENDKISYYLIQTEG
ncbi:hypothetical protein MKX54_01795 [Alkalihalobacillus sp. FSL R5-0424]